MTLLAVFVFLLVFYFVVLRRFNSTAGFLCLVCMLISMATAYSWWSEKQTLQNVAENGISGDGFVWEKKQQGRKWLITIVIQGPDYDLDMRPLDQDISRAEMETVKLKEIVKIRFVPTEKVVMLEQSYQRRLALNKWFWLVPALFLLLGGALLYFLRGAKR